MTIYAVVRGSRYQIDSVLCAHATVEGARAAALSQMDDPNDWTEQDPPADGMVVSWINHCPNFYGIKELELLD